MKIPFRLELRTLDNENDSGSITYAAALEAMSQRQVNTLETLIDHPDERVLLGLIQDHYELVDPDFTRIKSVDWSDAKRRLLTRIYSDAEKEGTLWTPLIDAIVKKDWVANQRIVRKPLEQIARWAEEASEFDLDIVMRSFEAPDFRRTIATFAGNVSHALAREWMKPGVLLSRSWLCQNPSLKPDVVETLAEILVSDIRAYARGERPSTDSFVALAFLYRSGHQVPHRFLREIFTIAPLPEEGSVDQTKQNVFSDLVWFANRIISELPGITEEDLLIILRATANETRWAEKMVHHSAAGVRLWTEALAKNRGWRLKAEIAKHEPARQDPTIRQHLLKSNALDVLVEMCEELEPARFRELIRRAAARRPQLAARALDRARLDQLRELEPEDLGPLFAFANQNVRLSAMLALGKLRGARGKEPMREPKKDRGATIRNEAPRR